MAFERVGLPALGEPQAADLCKVDSASLHAEPDVSERLCEPSALGTAQFVIRLVFANLMAQLRGKDAIERVELAREIATRCHEIGFEHHGGMVEGSACRVEVEIVGLVTVVV